MKCAALVYHVHILADCNKRSMFEVSHPEYSECWSSYQLSKKKLDKLGTGNLTARFSIKLVKSM